MQKRAASNILPPEGKGARGGSWGETASPTQPRTAGLREAAGASAPRTGARPADAGSSCAASELRWELGNGDHRVRRDLREGSHVYTLEVRTEATSAQQQVRRRRRSRGYDRVQL